MAVNKDGSNWISNVGKNDVNALTLRVFPTREIIQPIVVDPASFLIWKNKAFEIWSRCWASLNPEGDPSRQLISQYTSLKLLGDRVLVKIKTAKEKTEGGILLPTTAHSKPQGGEVVAIAEGRTVGKNKVDITVKAGAQIIYSKYAGTELEFRGANHLLLKEDDILGILETSDVKDLQPLNQRVLIKVAEAEEKIVVGLLLMEATKEIC